MELESSSSSISSTTGLHPVSAKPSLYLQNLFLSNMIFQQKLCMNFFVTYIHDLCTLIMLDNKYMLWNFSSFSPFCYILSLWSKQSL
jgi:hypothetical protein